MGGRIKRSKKEHYARYDNNVIPLFDEETGRRRKTWSTQDLKNIRAMNPRQEDFLQYWFEGNNVCGHGTAGTGKSFLAVYAALTSILEPRDKQTRVIIVRSAVSTREIGHLPGTEEEKQAVFERPYKSIFQKLLGRESSYDDMKAAGKVEFHLTSHIRSETWDDAVVIVDEAQNMNMMEIDGVITRLGRNSRFIVLGDTRYQQDLKRHEVSGLQDAIRVFAYMDDTVRNRDSGVSTATGVVEYTSDDIVRGPTVKAWIKAREALKV